MRNAQDIVFQVLFDDEPTAFLPFSAAEIQPLALAERIIHQPHMLAHDFARLVDDLTRLCGQVIFQKIAEIPLSNKADARAVLFPGGGKPAAFGNFAHLAFFQFAQREKHVFKLRLRDLIEKIRLIFPLVGGFARQKFTDEVEQSLCLCLLREVERRAATIPEPSGNAFHRYEEEIKELAHRRRLPYSFYFEEILMRKYELRKICKTLSYGKRIAARMRNAAQKAALRREIAALEKESIALKRLLARLAERYALRHEERKKS